jgi:hypothetical protein
MGKDKQKGKGGGFGKVVVGVVVLVAAVGGGLWFFAPDVLQQGLQMVGLSLPR